MVDVDSETMRLLLESVRAGQVSPDEALEQVTAVREEDLGFAVLDHERVMRRGFPEAVYCPGKTPAQVAAIVERLAQRGGPVLATRADLATFAAVQQRTPTASWHEDARAIVVEGAEREPGAPGILVVSAGTADGPVAAEAALTATLMGQAVERIDDVGVAGLHRLLARLDRLRAARVVVVVAGMDGALPSVVAGLLAAPVIAVPTSTGYGAAFGGVSALLTMLSSCAGGIATVNIDNGYGAGLLAAMINRLAIRTGTNT